MGGHRIRAENVPQCACGWRCVPARRGNYGSYCATSTIYFATRRSWGIYRLPLGGRPEPLPLPEVLHAGYVQVYALALWNNQLAIATSFGLCRYDLNARQLELVYDTPSIRYLIAAETRLWGFGSEIVAFDRDYRVVERQAAQVSVAPVWEESRFWWASAGRGVITLHSYTPTTRRIRQSRFRMDEATQVVSSRLQATALARHRLGWYVGLSARVAPNPPGRRRSSTLCRLPWRTDLERQPRERPCQLGQAHRGYRYGATSTGCALGSVVWVIGIGRGDYWHCFAFGTAPRLPLAIVL